MRAGFAAGTAPTDPFVAIVAGGATQAGRGTGVPATSFGAALELAERMLDAPSGSEAQASTPSPATAEFPVGPNAAPNAGEGATDSAETASSEAAGGEASMDPAMISAMSVASTQTSSPTMTVLDPSDADAPDTEAADAATPAGVVESRPAAMSASASPSAPTMDAGDSVGALLGALPASATEGADAARSYERMPSFARAAVDAVPTVPSSTTVPSFDAAPPDGSLSGTAGAASVIASEAARVEASARPAGASSAAPSSAIQNTAAASSGTVADRTEPPAGPATAAPSTPSVVPAASAPAPGVAVVSAPEPAASARSVATQVSPVVVSIAQRPAGSHQLTMTVAPDTLGPVTVRAHIGQNGDVRVELVGATDAGREALRAIVSDLRRDLAAVLPHANLSLASASASSSDAGGAERFAQPGADQGAGGHADGRRGSGADVTSGARADAPPARALPTSTPAVAGAGLDTFA
jgi:flagellar hook-length control protein FliK